MLLLGGTFEYENLSKKFSAEMEHRKIGPCLQNSKNSISRVKFLRTISFVASATGGL
jgi:hypothetical protein